MPTHLLILFSIRHTKQKTRLKHLRYGVIYLRWTSFCSPGCVCGTPKMYVANREVAGCPLPDKLCNINTQNTTEECLSNLHLSNFHLLPVINADTSESANI